MSSSANASYKASLARLKEHAANGGRIPAFFFAHGSPLLVWPKHLPTSFPLKSIGGPDGPLSQFLKDFGPFLRETYKPKAIVVFSAHWETQGGIEVMDYETNPLLYDYYGFPDEMYQIKFESKGDSEVAKRVVDLLKKANIPAKSLKKGRGLDHGVFVPFKLMFPSPVPFDIPIIEVSMDSGLDPARLIEIGRALDALRDEGILILSGGLTIHTFREPEAWDPSTAPQGFKDFHTALVQSLSSPTPEQRTSSLINITTHPYFRRAHPREEHFVPIYVAAGAGAEGGAEVVSDLHGAVTVAFGL